MVRDGFSANGGSVAANGGVVPARPVNAEGQTAGRKKTHPAGGMGS